MDHAASEKSGAARAGHEVSPPSSLSRGSHTAHFYSDDASLLGEVGQFLSAELANGGAGIIIADQNHRKGLAKYIETRDIDLARASSQGRWIALDASATLSEFMVDGRPDAQRFNRLMNGIFDQLATAAKPLNAATPIAAYDEMVTVLWTRGKREAAIRLEELWAALGQKRTFHLSCGWPLNAFTDARDADAVDQICALHTDVLPRLGYHQAGSNDRRRGSFLWQLKANTVLQRVSSISRQTLGFYRDLSSPAWIDIQEAIEDVLAIHEQRLRSREIAVRRKIRPNLRIFASLGEVKYILSKLLANAFDSSFQGSVIYVSAIEARNSTTGVHGVRISFGDQGLGLDPSLSSQVFSPYFASQKDIRVGLGLWTVKDLLDRRGGYIRCRSKVTVPSGTIMTAFLPKHPTAVVSHAAA